MQTITWQDFEKVELRVETVISAKNFYEARKPSYKLEIGLGRKLELKNPALKLHISILKKPVR